MVTSREEKLEKQRFWRVNGHHVVLDSKVSVVLISLLEKGSKLSPALIQLVKSGQNTRLHPPACPLMCILSAHLSLAVYGSKSEFMFNFPLAVAQ